MSRFQNSVTLITGAARGFGALAAREFAREGARLVLSDIHAAALAETAASLRAQGAEVEVLAGDVSQEAAAVALVALAKEKFGRLDIAVNNAGVGQPFMRIEATSMEIMRSMLDVNVMGVFLGMKHQIPLMLEHGGGVILNVSSVSGVVGAPLIAAYAASKHAVIGLTKSVAGEVARKNIRVNAICPAFAATNMVTDMLDIMPGGVAEASARVVSNMPMRRIAEPSEIVQAMLFMCGPENSFMTGHALVVDGGLSAV